MAYGTLTTKPFRRTRYRREILASGIFSRRFVIACSWAASMRARYEREKELARFSFLRAPTVAKAFRGAAAASGASSSVTMTRARDCGVPRRGRSEGVNPMQARLGALDDAPRVGVDRAGCRSGGGDEQS